MERSVQVNVDVGGGRRVAAAVHLPVSPDDGTPTVVAVGLPGGGLSQGYFSTSLDGGTYDQAAFHTARGWIVVAVDHLGVGASSQPDPASLTYAELARADHLAVTEVVRRLREGSLADGLGPIAVAATVGMGHSMGGCIAIAAQGVHRTFDALAVLGFSAVQTVIPTPAGTLDVDLKARDDVTAELEASIDAAGGVERFRWAFYWEDVPASIVDADMGAGYPRTVGSLPEWGSATTPPVVFSMLSPGVVAHEAAGIEVPVLVCAGQRDVIPDLRAEPAAYRSSRHITVVEIPAMAHMHNLAGTRALLWDRLHRWADAALQI